MNLNSLLLSRVKSELARRNFLDFVKFVKPDYEVNWHHALLASYLQRFVSGEIKRLMVFMPPQHGKSELVSRQLPAFILGRRPESKIILASYSADLSNKFNLDCQRIIDSDKYADVFPLTKLKGNDVETKGNWARNSEMFEVVGYGGSLKTVGVGGSLTGNPADFAIIDDPVKDSIEAMSPRTQQTTWDWFNDVLYTRIHNNSSILITQTRWDVNDLSGKLLDAMHAGGEQWVILNLPAIRTESENSEDPRQIGEALWPNRHSLEKLHLVRSRSLRTFEALYQQNPKPIQAGGEYWKQFNLMKHVQDVRYTPDTNLHVSLDNNVNPYVTIAIWQMCDKLIKQIHEIPAKDPNNNAPKAAKLLVRWLQEIDYKGVIFLYGDPSASAKSTVDENSLSFFAKFTNELAAAGYIVRNRVAKSSPRVALRGSFINDIYERELFGYSIAISQNCTVSIEDYYTVKEDKDGGMQKIKRKDPTTGITYEPYGHFSDAKAYFICELLKQEFNSYTGRTRTQTVYSV